MQHLTMTARGVGALRVTEVLYQEHRVIEQVLTCLDRMAAAARVAGRCDWASAAQALDFLRTFADRCHHAKEEDELFPMLEARGLPAESGPTAVMRSEHAVGRQLMARMAQAVERGQAGVSAAAEAFAAAATEYIALLRQHIRKEDHCLFPMADQVLRDDDQAALANQFAAAEERADLAGEHERCLLIANELAERFGVCRSAGGGACGCGHRS